MVFSGGLCVNEWLIHDYDHDGVLWWSLCHWLSLVAGTRPLQLRTQPQHSTQQQNGAQSNYDKWGEFNLGLFMGITWRTQVINIPESWSSLEKAGAKLVRSCYKVRRLKEAWFKLIWRWTLSSTDRLSNTPTSAHLDFLLLSWGSKFSLRRPISNKVDIVDLILNIEIWNASWLLILQCSQSIHYPLTAVHTNIGSDLQC